MQPGTAWSETLIDCRPGANTLGRSNASGQARLILENPESVYQTSKILSKQTKDLRAGSKEQHEAMTTAARANALASRISFYTTQYESKYEQLAKSSSGAQWSPESKEMLGALKREFKRLGATNRTSRLPIGRDFGRIEGWFEAQIASIQTRAPHANGLSGR